MSATNPSRRGTALLVALAALLVAVGAATTLARVTATTQAHRRAERSTALTEDLRRACEAPILRWLESEAGRVVLPPEVRQPRVKILRDRIDLAETTIEVTVTAWDQHGMVPMSVLRGGSPLRGAVPSDVLRRVDALDLDADGAPGLDLFVAPWPEDGRVFPLAGEGVGVRFGALRGGTDDHHSPGRTEDEEPPPALGALVATHDGDPGAINVNTAPIALVEQALRLAGRGGIEIVVAAREEGRPATVPLGDRAGDQIALPALATRSRAWAFRIDVRIDGLRRSWWAVYEPARPRPGTRTLTWECVQRLAIGE